MPTLTELKEKARKIESTVRIGKAGITDGTVYEIKNQLKKYKLVKIKCLPAFLENEGKEKKDIVDELAKKCEATLVQSIGFVIVLYKGFIDE